MIRHGLRLRWLFDPDNDTTTLHDVYVIARACEVDRESALYREQHPEEWAWGPVEMLLALVADNQAWQMWQASGDEKAPKPKPIPRPGIVDQNAPKSLWDAVAEETPDAEPVEVAELDARDWLGWNL